jgi:uracil-DNA glycosylase
MANEIELLLPTVKTFVTLGNFAWTGLIAQMAQMNLELPSPRPKFGHGATFVTTSPNGATIKVIGSYHPSQQNTFTKKLTPAMLDAIFKMANKS